MKAFTRKHSAFSTEKRPRSVAWLMIFGCGLLLTACKCLPAGAQAAEAITSHSTVDKGVLLPPSQALRAGVQDKTALAMLHSYQTAVGPATWTDMEAMGEIFPATLRSNGATSGQDATLRILGHQGYRLDIQTPRGPISIRMDGAYGAMQPPGSHVILMDAPDAVMGLLAFPQLQDADFPAKNISLIDQGTVSVDGVFLHRITFEMPWTGASASGEQGSGTSTTDLYFDPATHLLAKSVNMLQGTDHRLTHYVRVISYGDYRPMGKVRLPFLISESLNGRRIWTLKLDRVQLNCGISVAAFKF